MMEKIGAKGRMDILPKVEIIDFSKEVENMWQPMQVQKTPYPQEFELIAHMENWESLVRWSCRNVQILLLYCVYDVWMGLSSLSYIIHLQVRGQPFGVSFLLSP